MKNAILIAVAILVLNSCGGGGGAGGGGGGAGGRGGNYGRISLNDAPKVVNVSSYDPKERQRPGDSFSEHDVSALKRNGAHGLIARCGKDMVLDDKCADFLSSANRSGLMLGTYYFVRKTSNPTRQADQYIDRLQQIAAQRGLTGRRILLVGDFDTKSSPGDLVAFIDRVEQRTGVQPVIYLENGDQLRATMRSATPAQKHRICQCPYWLALYSPSSSFGTPKDLMQAYGMWDQWAMWQYGGVEWSGRSVSKHFSNGPWKSPTYFGSMDRPLEHNAFNGDVKELHGFWAKHSWAVH